LGCAKACPRSVRAASTANASIVTGYLEHQALAAAELSAERFMLKVALARVLCAHALAAAPRLALGPLAPLGPSGQISPTARITRAAPISSAPDLVSTVPAERRPSWPTPRCTKKPPDCARTPTSSSSPASHCMPSG
jgi:hypothetical protein